MAVSSSRKKSTGRFDSHRIKLRTGESQRENGTYSYRWTDQNGKRQAVYAPTLEALREKEEQILVDSHDGIIISNKNMALNDLFDLWTQLKRGLKDSTFKNYIYMYNMYVRHSFGKLKIKQINKSDVRRFYNQLADDKILKMATIDLVHSVLHQVFQVGVDDRLIRINPTDGMLRELKLCHGCDSEAKRALTLDEQSLFFHYLLKTPKYTHWYPIFYIMANTGMRVGEITGLRWRDVDLKEAQISINHTLVYYDHMDEKGCYFSINTPKTKAAERTIPMTEAVKEAFLMEKKSQDAAGMCCKVRIEGYDDFIFLNRSGGVQSAANLNKALRRIMRDCNMEMLETHNGPDDPVLLPPFSCHILRHTFATRLCESGVNIKVIQNVLGHADIDTTMNIYVDVTRELKNKEMLSFSEYINSKTERY